HDGARAALAQKFSGLLAQLLQVVAEIEVHRLRSTPRPIFSIAFAGRCRASLASPWTRAIGPRKWETRAHASPYAGFSLALPKPFVGPCQTGQGSAKPAAVERDEAFPVALGSRLVVDLALGEREPMMHAGVELELAGTPGFPEQASQLLNHRQRRQLVDFRAGDIELGLALAERQVEALHRVAHEPCAVKGRRSSDARGIACGCGEGVGPAQAIAVYADGPTRDALRAVEVGDHGSDIAHDRRDGHSRAH